jgi:hypothetical protein
MHICSTFDAVILGQDLSHLDVQRNIKINPVHNIDSTLGQQQNCATFSLLFSTTSTIAPMGTTRCPEHGTFSLMSADMSRTRIAGGPS